MKDRKNSPRSNIRALKFERDLLFSSSSHGNATREGEDVGVLGAQGQEVLLVDGDEGRVRDV